MINERYSVPRDHASESQTGFLIADEYGQITDTIHINTPIQEYDSSPELVLPKNFQESILMSNTERVLLPNPLGSVIRLHSSDAIQVAGGFDAGLRDSYVSESLQVHLADKNEQYSAKENEEREREELARQCDMEQLAKSPIDFLTDKILQRISAHDEMSSDPDKSESSLFYLTAFAVIRDPYIQSIKGDVNLYGVLAEVARGESLGGVSDDRDIDESILTTATDCLDEANQNERKGIYDFIGQIEVPLEYQEKLLWRMEEKNDYQNNPLAARYALHQYEENNEGRWVAAQAKRQRLLKLFVSSSPEVALRNFEESMRLASKLVFSSDPTKMPDGKVGMEFEGRTQLLGRGFTTISDQWRIGNDLYMYTELRKSPGKLRPSDYPSALIEYDEWAADNFTSSLRSRYRPHQNRTMHIHLDRDRHPECPLYHLFDEDIKENDLGTWEIRGVMPFQSAAETLAFVELSLRSAAGEAHRPFRKVQSTEEISSWQQLLYGHIVRSTTDPSARVAALVSLRDPFAMRGFDIKPLIDTYGREILGLLNSQSSTFLAGRSLDHHLELYAQCMEHDVDRDPQEFYDIITNPSAAYRDIAATIQVIGVDQRAHEFLIQFLKKNNSNDRVHYTHEYIAKWMENISLDSALQILPIMLADGPGGVDTYSRRVMLKKIMQYEEIAVVLEAELRKPELSNEIRNLISYCSPLKTRNSRLLSRFRPI